MSTCIICKQEFQDMGTHPITCGKKDCLIEAMRNGEIAKCEEKKHNKWLQQTRKMGMF